MEQGNGMDHEQAERLRAALKAQLDWFALNWDWTTDEEFADRHSWNYVTKHELKALHIPAGMVCQCIVAVMLYEEFAEIVDHHWPVESDELLDLIGKLKTARPDLVEKSNKPLDDELEVFTWLGVNFCGLPERVLFSWYLKTQINQLGITNFPKRREESLFLGTDTEINRPIGGIGRGRFTEELKGQMKFDPE